MKLLKTEQQTDLLDLLSNLEARDHEQAARLKYWQLELKPKRPRRLDKPAQV